MLDGRDFFAQAQTGEAGSAQPSASEAETGGGSEAAEETGGEVACLWSRLDPHYRLRLTLASRWRAEDPAELIIRVDPTATHKLIVACGFEPDTPMTGLLTQYWSAQAAKGALEAELKAAGLSLDTVERALAARAPAGARRALAVEIMDRRGAAAQTAIRAAIAQVGAERAGAKVPAETPDLLARYFATRILIDGLEAGARAPELN